MSTIVMTVKVEFTTELLGSVPKNQDIYSRFVASKADNPDAAEGEMETVPFDDQKGYTGFHTDEDGPFVFDYVWKGFFKDACSALRRVPKTHSKKLTAYKRVIDGLIFPEPRKIHLALPKGKELSVLERPLRAQTAQGERIALAKSDIAPIGTSMEFDLLLLDENLKAIVLEWLDYGRLKGLGQWRNAGYGRFTYWLPRS